jgi:Colon cancer-associated protein Mic1-like
VVVPQLGRLWHIQLNLTHLYQSISEPVRLVDILAHRDNSEFFILNLLNNLTTKFEIDNYAPMHAIFDRLNRIYKYICHDFWFTLSLSLWYLPNVKFLVSRNKLMAIQRLQEESSNQVFVKVKTINKIYIDQNDMLENVFNKISDPKQVEFVLLVYLDSLVTHQIEVGHKLSRRVVQTMVVRGKVKALEQMLSEQTIKDSQNLVDYLLTFNTEENPQFFQLALDMLIRLREHEVSVFHS